MDDEQAITRIVTTFFAAFTQGPDLGARLEALRELFLPGASIIKTCGGEPTVYDLDSFIAPRHTLLTDGTLTEFREWEVNGRTDVFGDIAHHWCSYAKAGSQNGAAFTGAGMKTLQLVRTGDGWRISAAAWDDERN